MRGKMLATLASLALCGAWMTGSTEACLAAALLIAPILIDRLWKGRGLPAMHATLGERRTQVGSLFLESIELHNDVGGRVVHDLRLVEPRIGTRMGGGFVEALLPSRGVRLQVPSRCLRRGRTTRRTFRCETSYPLGILRNQAEITCEAELVAEPARIALPSHLLRSAEDSSAEPSSRSLLGSHEFYALREYRLGEDARGVHALRSAAAGTLVCREMRGQEERHPCMVLDLRRPPGYSTRRTGPRFEWSLSAAATLVDELRRANSHLTCFVLEAEPRVFSVSNLTEAEELLTFFAEARPSQHATLAIDVRDQIANYASCYWIPAGGFAARHERGSLGHVLLVTREPEEVEA